MWDTYDDTRTAASVHLGHDPLCQSCGHALHTFLACGDDCACPPATRPGVHAA